MKHRLSFANAESITIPLHFRRTRVIDVVTA